MQSLPCLGRLLLLVAELVEILLEGNSGIGYTGSAEEVVVLVFVVALDVCAKLSSQRMLFGLLVPLYSLGELPSQLRLPIKLEESVKEIE